MLTCCVTEAPRLTTLAMRVQLREMHCSLTINDQRPFGLRQLHGDNSVCLLIVSRLNSEREWWVEQKLSCQSVNTKGCTILIQAEVKPVDRLIRGSQGQEQ